MLSDDDINDVLERVYGFRLERWELEEGGGPVMELSRAIESAACAERDARIAELERQLEEARKVLKETGLLLHHFWCDVQMNDYSFDKLNKGIEAIDAATKEQT